MSRWSYGPDNTSRPRVPARQPEVRPASGVSGRDESRPGPEFDPTQPLVSSPVPAPEEWKRHDVLELRTDLPRHRGRREDGRGRQRRTREQRVQHVLDTVGTYRVVSRRSLVDHCFDGHPFAAARTLPALVREGLVAINMVPVGRRAYQVVSLTPAGRDRIAFGARKRRRGADGEEDSDPQRYWIGLADVRQLEHDHHVFEAVMQDTEDVRNRGGRIRRIRLESELRGLLAAAGETVRQREGPAGAARARRQEAVRIGLRVFAEGVPLPDALVEIEDSDGTRSVRAIEVVTAKYTNAQVRAKQRAGFRLYAVPGFRTEGRRRQFGQLDREDLFPLSWGSGR